MKKVISSVISPNQRFLSLGLLFLRVLVGITMLTHGLAKLTSFSELSSTFPDPIGLGGTLSLVMIICAEVGCSIFLIVGAFTRLATIPLIFSMLVVLLVVHGSDPFQVKELPLLYLGVYIFLFFTGAGKISLDSILLKKINTSIPK
ncbi:DoxX family protein [Butyricimonas synergistica]|uniref:DoxX family protein n=1 Tax=Butyricimonas synergistica TaxID=544644 RepID=UPI00037E0921|nr:DoxX family protein [Butyricimonas synergistica]